MDAYLDWHHMNIRAGAGGLIFRSYFQKNMVGFEASKESIQETKMILKNSLETIENFWLKKSKYLFGSEPSIADLSLACELTQL